MSKMLEPNCRAGEDIEPMDFVYRRQDGAMVPGAKRYIPDARQVGVAKRDTNKGETFEVAIGPDGQLSSDAIDFADDCRLSDFARE